MRVEVPHKESKKSGQESIEFPYDLMTDEPDEVVGEMVRGRGKCEGVLGGVEMCEGVLGGVEKCEGVLGGV